VFHPWVGRNEMPEHSILRQSTHHATSGLHIVVAAIMQMGSRIEFMAAGARRVHTPPLATTLTLAGYVDWSKRVTCIDRRSGTWGGGSHRAPSSSPSSSLCTPLVPPASTTVHSSCPHLHPHPYLDVRGIGDDVRISHDVAGLVPDEARPHASGQLGWAPRGLKGGEGAGEAIGRGQAKPARPVPLLGHPLPPKGLASTSPSKCPHQPATHFMLRGAMRARPHTGVYAPLPVGQPPSPPLPLPSLCRLPASCSAGRCAPAPRMC
jgi:hypothetical protein